MSEERRRSREIEKSRDRSAAEDLAVPEHALKALEYQARRHYRRWWLDEAERIARMVIRFDVGRAEPWFVLGDIEMRRMDWRRAFGYFQQAADCRRADAMTWCRGAEALFHLGELERAEKWLQSAIAIAPPEGSPGAKRARAFLARHRHDFDRAQQRGVESKPSNAPTMKLEAFQSDRPPQKPRRNVRELSRYSRDEK